jgi:hypothetical protein
MNTRRCCWNMKLNLMRNTFCDLSESSTLLGLLSSSCVTFIPRFHLGLLKGSTTPWSLFSINDQFFPLMVQIPDPEWGQTSQ